MRQVAMDQSFTRGAAAAVLFVGVWIAPVGAQVAGAVQVRPTRDSFFVRVIDGTMRAKLDSIIRLLDNEQPSSQQAMQLRGEIEATMRAFARATAAAGAAAGVRPSQIFMSESRGPFHD